MPFNGSGTFTKAVDWATEAGSPPVAVSNLDTSEGDIATGLSNCITKDGQTTITADIPFNNKKITGLADASAATDALNRQTADARYALVASNSFTATLNGVSGSVTGTMEHRSSGNLSTLYLNSALVGTSNDTVMTVTGVPVAARPSVARTVMCGIIRDNGSGIYFARATIGTTGTITFVLLGVGAAPGKLSDGQSFTASGSKGLEAGWCVSYPL